MSHLQQNDDQWFAAAKSGNMTYVQENCAKYAGTYSKNGLTALHVAAKHNQPAVVQILAPYEARLRSSTEMTALMIAAVNNYDSVVKILAPFESRIISNNTTAIILAARHGNKASVEVLLQYEYLWIGHACKSAHIQGQFEVANFLQEQIQFPQYVGSLQCTSSGDQASEQMGVQDLDNSTQSALFSQQQVSNLSKITHNSQVIENDNVTKYFKFTETVKELETKLQDQIRLCAANQQQNISYFSKLKEQESILHKAKIQCMLKDETIKQLRQKIEDLEQQIQQLIKYNSELSDKMQSQYVDSERQYKRQCYEQGQQKLVQEKQADQLKKQEQTIKKLESDLKKTKEDAERRITKALQQAARQVEAGRRITSAKASPSSLQHQKCSETPSKIDGPTTNPDAHGGAAPQGEAIFKVKSDNY